jgi:hypothetical protein
MNIEKNKLENISFNILNKKSIESTDNFNMSNIQIKLKTKLAIQLNVFISLYREYSKTTIKNSHLKNLKHNTKIDSADTKVDPVTIFAYHDNKTGDLEILETRMKDNDKILIASGEYHRTRYQTGWDKFSIKTYEGSNPLIQCWASGLIEGILSYKEIYYYHNNIEVFFKGSKELIKDIKNFYDKIDANLRKHISEEAFEKLKDNPNENTVQHWSYITCFNAQINGLYTGYNKIADEDKKLTLSDFYFINSEGNFGDLKTFFRINDMKDTPKVDEFYTKENLMKIYDTTDLDKIWKSIIRSGHCSAIVKMMKDSNGKLDMFAGHNTWTDYCEMLRSLKYVDYAFEGKNPIIGMKPRKINFSSYPGVLFSGDDFYEMDSKVVVIQTTLSVLNKFVYKEIIDLDKYIPEFMRLMITNHISNSAKEWVENYESYKNHMYITQWLVMDYNILDKINENRDKFLTDKISGLVYIIEEVPGNIISKDITNLVLEQGYFGSFNLAYFKENQKILGLYGYHNIDFTSASYNPRYYILQSLENKVKNLEDFSNLMTYNGYRKKNPDFINDPSYDDPESGISSRGDLRGNFNGGVDFKIVDSDHVKNMSIVAHGGPTYNKNPNLFPFDFKTLSDKSENSYHKGIPEVWNFSPILFSKKDFNNFK